MGRHRLRTLSESERKDEVSVGNFLAKCIENIEESEPGNPLDSIYLVDKTGYTCMDYFEIAARGNNTTFRDFNTRNRITVTEYGGRNAWLRDYLRRYGRYTSTISNALIEMYHKNPFIRDTDNHCTVELLHRELPGSYLGGERKTIERANCLLDTMYYLQETLKTEDLFSAYYRLLDNIVATPDACVTDEIADDGSTYLRRESCLAPILTQSQAKFNDSSHTGQVAKFLLNPRIDLLEQKCYKTKTGDHTQRVSCFERVLGETDSVVRKMLELPSTSRNLFNYLGVRGDYSGYSFPVTGYQYLLDADINRFLNTVSNAESEFEKVSCYTRSGAVPCQDTLLGMMVSSESVENSKAILTYIFSKFEEYRTSFERTKYGVKTKTGETIEVPVINQVVDAFLNARSLGSEMRDRVFGMLLTADLSSCACVMKDGDVSNCITKIMMYGDEYATRMMFKDYGSDRLKKEKCYDMRGDLTSCVDAFFQRIDYADNANVINAILDETRAGYSEKLHRSRSEERSKEYSKLYSAASDAQTKHHEWVNKIISPRYDKDTLSDVISNGTLDIVGENCRVPRVYIDLSLYQNNPSVMQYLLAAQESEEKARRARSPDAAAKHAASAAENKTIAELVQYVVASKEGGLDDIEVISKEALNFFSVVVETNRRIAASKSPKTRAMLESQRNDANTKYTYLYEYLKRITSNRPRTTSCIQRSFEIIERSAETKRSGVASSVAKSGMYAIVDAIRKNAESALIKYDLVQSRCLGRDGTRIPCIQKYIDVIMENGPMYTGERSIANIFIIPSTFKRVCRGQNNDFVNCIDYAISNYGVDILSGNESVSILLNEDFGNIRKQKITMPDGTQTTIGQLVCRNVTVKEVYNKLYSMGRVRRELTGIYGPALDIVAKCKCSDKSPVENWICTNKECLESTVTKRSYPWAERFFDPNEGMKPRKFMGESDWLGLSGTYDIIKPALSVDELERYSNRATEALNLAILDLQNTRGIVNVEVVSPPPTTVQGYSVFNSLLRDYAIRIITLSETKLVWISDIERESVIDGDGHTIQLVSAITSTSMDAIRAAIKDKPTATGTPLKLIISNRPYDMMRATSCQMWPSCFNLDSGAYGNAIPSYMYSGGYIAYVASSEYPTTWLARAWLLPVDPAHTPSGAKACVYIGRTYGEGQYATLLKDGLQVIFRSKRINVDGCTHGTGMFDYITLSGLRTNYPLWESEILQRRCTDHIEKEMESIIEMIESSPISEGAKEAAINKERDALSKQYNCNQYTEIPSFVRLRASPFLDPEQKFVTSHISDNSYFTIYRDQPSVATVNTDSTILDVINRNISNFVGTTPKKLVVR